MATLLGLWRGAGGPPAAQRMTLDDYAAQVLNTSLYGSLTPGIPQTYGGRAVETIEGNFAGVVGGAYKRNGVVFACQVARLSVFAQASFAWKQTRPGPKTRSKLFTTDALTPLQSPWPNGSEGELLARMIQDVDNAGNAYVRRLPPTYAGDALLERLRPDWVDIVLAGEPGAVTPAVVGYLYHPGGRGSGREPVPLALDEVAHWSPYPDPLATYRGMAPITPILREVAGDNAATQHKGEFFANAATPNMALKYDPAITVDKFREFRDAFEAEHGSLGNAWKTLHLGGGADPVSVGNSFREMDYKQVQALGETRIAAAYGVPAAIAQISEGLAGSSLNAGNFGAARRLFADKTMRWLWKDCCASLERVVDVPNRARLWWDEREVSFLREDQKDAAEIQSTQAQTIASLVREGFTPESVIPAVLTEDFSQLRHTGKLSVQLQDPNAKPEPKPDAQDADGSDDASDDASDDE